MTQEPPQSWPRRDSGPDTDRTMAVDPLTGEPIPGWSGFGPDLTKSGQAPAGSTVPAPGAGPSDGPEGQAPGLGTAADPSPGYGVEGFPPPGHGAAACSAPGYGATVYPPPGYGPVGYPPPGYGTPPYPPPGYPWARPTNGLAIASLVLGAVWMFWIGSVLALVLGYVARGQIRRTGEGGDGVAVAGNVLGWIGVGFLVLLGVAGVLGDS